MKLSAYKDLESSKRAQTLSRIALIAGAHILIIGGAYIVTNFGSGAGDDANSPSLAGVGTWSSQSPDAQSPSVDTSADTLFDSRAGDLRGYNAGDPAGVLLAQNSSSQTTRYAPRRPSGSSSSASQPAPSSNPPASSSFGGNDDILRPIGRASDLSSGPVSSPSRPSAALSRTIEYKVKTGDSLWELSRLFKVSTNEIVAANPGMKANAIRVGQTINIPRSAGSQEVASLAAQNSSETPADDGVTYTVKAGDSLSKIASRQGVTVSQLKAENGLSNDMIRVGQKLKIPTTTRSSTLVSKQHRGQKVTVEAGDTLDKIAALHDVSVSELIKLNKISDPRFIRIGQTILIPEKSRPIVTSQPTPTRSAPVNTLPDTRSSQPIQRVEQPMRTLEDLSPAQNDQALQTLDEAFGEEDLEDQPLIQINE